MRRAVHFILKAVLFLVAALFGFGVMFWLATARPGDFYLRTAFRSGSVVSVWIRPSSSQNPPLRSSLHEANVSVWLNAERLPAALSHFDAWLQEFSLVSEEVESMDEGQAYALPPAPLPRDDEEQDEEFGLFAEEDPYDSAFATLIKDVWDSGFLTLGGSLHLRLPLWAKPFSGWLVAASGTRLSPLILDRLVEHFPLRSDRADFPSWLSELPFAQLQSESKDSVVQRLVVDVGGREIGELLATVCEMENLSDDLCHSDVLEDNPLLPLLYASEEFTVQLSFYYALRGQHVVWSNSKKCLLSLIQQPAPAVLDCGGQASRAFIHEESEYRELAALKWFADRQKNPSAGVWMNHVVLQKSAQHILTQLDEDSFDGASWFQDLLQTREGESMRRRMQVSLIESAHRWPLWGARVDYQGPQTGMLSTFVRHDLKPDLGESLPRIAADKQFHFLNGLFHIWIGQPRSTSRLQESRSWERIESYWRSESEYRIGWSEQE